MLDRYSTLDKIFFLILGVFACLGLYEIIEIIKPYYGTKRMLACFLVVISLYIIGKTYQKKDFVENIGKQVHKNIKLPSFLPYSTWIQLGVLYSLGFLTFIAFGLKLGDVYMYITGTLMIILTLVFTFSQYNFQKIELNPHRFGDNILYIGGVYFLLIYATYGLLDSRSLEGALANFAYIFVTLVSLVSILFLYFEGFTQRFVRGVMKPYNIMSIGLVSLLIGFLFVQNTSWYQSFVPTDTPSVIDEVPEVLTEKKKINELYTLTEGMSVGNRGGQVFALQEALKNLGYFNEDITGYFGEVTRTALRDALIAECGWPETTRGIFGPQAQNCINNLELDVAVESEDILSEEEQTQGEETPSKVSDLYDLPTGMGVGTVGSQVSDLQSVLSSLGYYSGSITQSYDEPTRVSLRNALIAECDWPESTRGIFGPLAKECIDNLTVRN